MPVCDKPMVCIAVEQEVYAAWHIRPCAKAATSRMMPAAAAAAASTTTTTGVKDRLCHVDIQCVLVSVPRRTAPGFWWRSETTITCPRGAIEWQETACRLPCDNQPLTGCGVFSQKPCSQNNRIFGGSPCASKVWTTWQTTVAFRRTKLSSTWLLAFIRLSFIWQVCRASC